MKRKPESEQFSVEMLNTVAGLTWSPTGKKMINRCQLGSDKGAKGLSELLPPVEGRDGITHRRD